MRPTELGFFSPHTQNMFCSAPCHSSLLTISEAIARCSAVEGMQNLPGKKITFSSKWKEFAFIEEMILGSMQPIWQIFLKASCIGIRSRCLNPWNRHNHWLLKTEANECKVAKTESANLTWFSPTQNSLHRILDPSRDFEFARELGQRTTVISL